MNIEEIRRLSLRYARGESPARPRKRRCKKNKRGKEWRGRYEAYMRSPEWRIFRDRILTERGRKCERCGSIEGVMHVHHLTYWRLGCERDTDVQVICADCHAKIHPQYGRGPKASFLRWFAWSLAQDEKYGNR
jgi:hypothetical protein